MVLIIDKVYEKGKKNWYGTRKVSAVMKGHLGNERSVPGSTRELELVRVLEIIESIRGRSSGPPDCRRVRCEPATDRWFPFAGVERERSGSFMADRNGFLVAEPVRLRELVLGWGVCVRGGRWVDC